VGAFVRVCVYVCVCVCIHGCPEHTQTVETPFEKPQRHFERDLKTDTVDTPTHISNLGAL